MAAKKEFTPIRSGVDPRDGAKEDESRASWLKIPPEKQQDVVILIEAEEILSVEQCAIWLDEGNSPVWVYTGPDDPHHDLKTERNYRAYLPVLLVNDVGDVTEEIGVWSMSKTSHRNLLDIADASGALKGMEVRIKRTGAGLKTRYSIVPKGKRRNVSKVEPVDVIAMLGPTDPEGVRELIAEKLGMDSYEAVLRSYRGKPIVAEKKSAVPERAKKKVAPVVEEIEEEEDDDLEDLELN